MGMILSEYDVERIYIPGSPSIQIYFRKQDEHITKRLRSLAKSDSGSFSSVVRSILCKEFGVSDNDLGKELKRRKSKQPNLKISSFVRDIIINKIKNGGK